MIRRAGWALCALIGLAACEEEPADTYTSGAVRDVQQASTAPMDEGPPVSADSCADATVGADGRLRCTFADGRKFDGEVEGGKANGPGKMWFTNGDRYSGNFVNGLFGGSGTYWYASGARYDGQFANGLRNGSGTTVWPNGSRYSGNYVHNKPNGYGTVTTANGTRSGQWHDGCLDSARVAIDATLAECGYE